MSAAGAYVPRGSTAKTAHGCLAEDYAPVLADVLRRWSEREWAYFRAHLGEMTDEDRLRLDVADSFCQTVASRDSSAPGGT
jgi:hypothetical protein